MPTTSISGSNLSNISRPSRTIAWSSQIITFIVLSHQLYSQLYCCSTSQLTCDLKLATNQLGTFAHSYQPKMACFVALFLIKSNAIIAHNKLYFSICGS